VAVSVALSDEPDVLVLFRENSATFFPVLRIRSSSITKSRSRILLAFLIVDLANTGLTLNTKILHLCLRLSPDRSSYEFLPGVACKGYYDL
jgi:hypothetical protein